MDNASELNGFDLFSEHWDERDERKIVWLRDFVPKPAERENEQLREESRRVWGRAFVMEEVGVGGSVFCAYL